MFLNAVDTNCTRRIGVLKCITCGFEQVSGKFCGGCGTQFGEIVFDYNQGSTPKRSVATQAEPNVHVEKFKNQMKLYGSYFSQQLKKPGLAYNRGEAEFTNGLISIILLGVIIALSLFTFMNQMIVSIGTGFFSFVSGALAFTLIAMGIVVISLFLINTFFGPQLSFKSIISLYGAHFSPLLIGAVISLILMLLKSFNYGNLILSIVFMITVFVLPLYLTGLLLTNKSTGMDPFYGFILYIVTFSILFAIFITVLADTTIGSYVDELMYWFQ
jgi:hypothetical protein